MTLSFKDIQQLTAIARGAGERIMPYFQQPQTQATRQKKDDSPLTDADMAAHHYILQALAKHFPGIPIVSEEDAASPPLGEAAAFFLVDPLDGTRSFVRGEAEFTVNIGLVEGTAPVFGVIHAPLQNITYFGGYGKAERKDNDREPTIIHTRAVPKEGLTVTRSRSSPGANSQAFLDSLNARETIPASSAIKLCWVAEGIADVYPRFGRTMEWDTAAGHAILNAAGGHMTTVDGASLTYRKPKFENPGFIAWGTSQ